MQSAGRNWQRLSDEQLLDLRLCDLKLRLSTLRCNRASARLYRELAARGISFRPHVWLAEEWFSPDGVPGFAVPFYLGTPAPDAPRAQDDRRGGGEQCQLADAHPAPRGRPRDRLGLPAATPRALARAVRPRLAPLRVRSIARDRRAATTCSTWASGTRRRIRPRISPRPSRSGCSRVPTGAAAMRTGRHGASSSSWSRSPVKSRDQPAAVRRPRS